MSIKFSYWIAAALDAYCTSRLLHNKEGDSFAFAFFLRRFISKQVRSSSVPKLYHRPVQVSLLVPDLHGPWHALLIASTKKVKYVLLETELDTHTHTYT